MIQLKEIPLAPFPEGECQRDSSEDDRLNENSFYLAKVDGQWCAGRCSRVPDGWNFDALYDAGVQLDMVEGPLYEIIED